MTTYQEISVLAETAGRMGFDDLLDCGSRVKSFGCHGSRPLCFFELAGVILLRGKSLLYARTRGTLSLYRL